jgi:hypothetical protein
MHPRDMRFRTSMPTSSSIHGLLAARAYAARLSKNLLAKSAADAAETPQLPGSAREHARFMRTTLLSQPCAIRRSALASRIFWQVLATACT